MNDRTTSGGSGAADEPGLTQRNSATVKGEEKLTDGQTDRILTDNGNLLRGAPPSAYGSHGGTAPQADEGSGANGSDGEDELDTEEEDSLQTEGLQPG